MWESDTYTLKWLSWTLPKFHILLLVDIGWLMHIHGLERPTSIMIPGLCTRHIGTKLPECTALQLTEHSSSLSKSTKWWWYTIWSCQSFTFLLLWWGYLLLLSAYMQLPQWLRGIPSYPLEFLFNLAISCTIFCITLPWSFTNCFYSRYGEMASETSLWAASIWLNLPFLVYHSGPLCCRWVCVTQQTSRRCC